MKKSILYFLMSAVMFTGVSCENRKTDDSKKRAEAQNEKKFNDSKIEKDADFAVDAADGNMLELQLGTLALTKSSSSQVKQFAQMMVDEHTKANNELNALAQQKHIDLPTVLGIDHQKKYDDLKGKTGNEFDQEYLDLMVKDHKADIREFEEEAKDGKDPEIKAWASSKVPALHHHLDEAERAQVAVKNDDHQGRK